MMIDENEFLTLEEFDLAWNEGRVCPNCSSIFICPDERDLHVMIEEQAPSLDQ